MSEQEPGAATPAQRNHQAEAIAIAFHDAYEDLAPDYGYRTREASAKPWDEIPAANAGLMVATVERLLEHGVIAAAAPAAGLGFATWLEARGINPDLSMVCSNFSPDDMRDAYEAGRAAAAPAAPQSDWRSIADQLAEAIRLTREYVAPKVDLPALPGWSWYDAVTRYNEADSAPAAPQDAGDTPSEYHLLAWAATLLACSAPGAELPPSHWHAGVGNWQDEYHALTSQPRRIADIVAGAYRAADQERSAEAERDHLRALLDKATRDHADVGLPGETARANANRVAAGLEPLPVPEGIQAAANELRERGQLGAL
jgi:hypothetical protein